MVTFDFLNTVIDTSCLLILIMFLFSFVEDRKRRLSTNSTLVVGTMLSAMLCVMNLITDGMFQNPSQAFQVFIMAIVGCISICGLCILCIYQLTTLITRRKTITWLEYCYYGYSLLWSLIAAIFAITGNAFVVQNGVCYPTDLWFGLLASEMLPLIVTCILVLITPGNSAQRLAFAAFNVLPAVGYLVIWYYPEISFESVLAVLEVGILYLSCYVQHGMRIYEQQIQLQESRNAVMNSQIKPHFLYNSIAAIVALCRVDGNKGADLLTLFGKYLRTNLDSVTAQSPVPFAQELKHIKIYVELEQARLGERLNMEYDITCDRFPVPMLSIQPLVENAIRHGISETVESGKVKLTTFEDEENWYVQVSDNGQGFVPGTTPKDGRSHIGITNVADRLQTMVDGRLEVESAPGEGTTVKVILPKKKGNGKK